jgi:Zn-dependent membrane protease YugP
MSETVFYVIGGISFLTSLAIRGWLNSAYKAWGTVGNSRRLTGAETAKLILIQNGLDTVGVEAVRGRLTDHYDPRSGTVRLSVGNFTGDSVAALAVSAHETGHALQDASGYSMMRLRSSLVPLVNLSAQLGPYVLLFGVIGAMPLVLQIGVVLFSGSVLFHLVTLPVEFNASHRALRQIENLQLVSEQEMAGARKVLMAAGMTYVAAAATQFAYLLYIIAFSRRRRQR